MKVLKYFFYILLIVFVLFLATGLIMSELTYEVEFEVNESKEICWNVFTDSSKLADWRFNFKSITAINTTDSIVGNKYLLTVIDAGVEYQMTETITSFEPDKKLTIRIENDVLINDVDYSFEESGEKTVIRTGSRLKGKDLLMKSIFPFMKSMFVNQATTELTRLKELIEDDER